MDLAETLAPLAGVWTPHPGQAEYLLARHPVRVLACGRRWGKTDACAADLTLALLRAPPGRHLLVAPTLEQARLLFDRTRDLLEAALVARGETPAALRARNSPYPRLEHGGHVLSARSGHRPRSLRGDEARTIVVDEAAFVDPALVDDVLRPMTATVPDARLSLISTPSGHDAFARMFRRGEAGDPDVWSRRAPTAENPRVSPGFLEVQRRTVSARTFAVEYEARFDSPAGALISAEAIEAALRPAPPDEFRGPVLAGVDWGLRGDHTAVAVVQGHREGFWVRECRRVSGGSWERVVAAVADALAPYPDAFVLTDATGVGDPVSESFARRAPGVRFRPFVFNAATREQLLVRLATAFERRAVSMLPDPLLREELDAFVARPTASGALRYAARGTSHDDLVMALALAIHDLPARHAPGVRIG